jgi:hypothetical protein
MWRWFRENPAYGAAVVGGIFAICAAVLSALVATDTIVIDGGGGPSTTTTDTFSTPTPQGIQSGQPQPAQTYVSDLLSGLDAIKQEGVDVDTSGDTGVSLSQAASCGHPTVANVDGGVVAPWRLQVPVSGWRTFSSPAVGLDAQSDIKDRVTLTVYADSVAPDTNLWGPQTFAGPSVNSSIQDLDITGVTTLIFDWSIKQNINELNNKFVLCDAVLSK